MSNVTIYKLNNIKQLIDLNKDKKNFELDFQVESSDGKHFDALVVTQEMLDSENPLEYQKAEGFISGKIFADKDIFQNYFLLLKSSEPVECKVMINIKDIVPNLNSNQPLQPPSNQQQPYSGNFKNQKDEKESSLKKNKNNPPKKSWFTLKNLIFVGLIILGAALIWYFYFNKKNEEKIPPTPVPQILNTDDITNEITAKFDAISDGLNSKLSKNLLSINDNITNKISEMGDGISAKVSDGLNSKIDNISSKVDGIGPRISDGINTKFDNISNKVDGIGPRISDGINTKFDNISNKVDGLGPKISDGITTKMSELKDGITDGLSTNIGEIKNQIEKIKIQSKNDMSNKNEGVLKKIKDFKIPDM